VNNIVGTLCTVGEATSPRCLVCDDHSGVVAVPGGFLIENQEVIAFHCPPTEFASEPYLGHLLVTPRRHVPSFAELNEGEASRMGVAISRLSSALRDDGAPRVYLATIGHGVDHLHVHLLPRWPETPVDVPWHGVDEWVGARRGDATAVEEATDRLRRFLTEDET
jgi:histidine triad (HIT) family protein